MANSSQVAQDFLDLTLRVPHPEEALSSRKTGKLSTLALGKLQVNGEHRLFLLSSVFSSLKSEITLFALHRWEEYRDIACKALDCGDC